MNALHAEQVTLQAAVQRGYLTPAQLEAARGLAAQPGAPGLLQLLGQRFLRPEHAAELGRLYQQALQAPAATPGPGTHREDAERTVVTDSSSALIAPPGAGPGGAGPGGSSWTGRTPPGTGGFQRSGVLAGPPPSARYPQAGQAPPPGPVTGRLGGSGVLSSSAVSSAAARQGPAGAGETLGPYRLVRELARGGMGVVYEAERAGLDRRVALKQLLGAGEPAEIERFLVEARIAARLRHPNIVGIHDVGEAAGQPYFAMDFLEGEDLAARLKRGPLPPREAAELVRKLADALAYAHGRAVLHRDIKPANVIVTTEGEPVLTDFGLAKDVEGADESGLTQAGAIMGTPSYMPPEQAEGASDLIDRRADIYSLGATLYALLTGQPPFSGNSVLNTITKVLKDDPVPPRKLRPELERDLEVICLTCLEKAPEARYQTAKALGEDLRRYLGNEPILARPPSLPERLGKWVRRNRALSAVVAASALLLLGGAGAAFAWQRQAAAAVRAEELSQLRDQAMRALERVEAEGQSYAVAFPLALDALQETGQWSSRQPEDPEAREAYLRAVLLLGRLALEERQWTVAEHAFARAATILPDRAEVAAAQARLGDARTAEQRRRAQVTQQVLATVRAGCTRGEVQEGFLTLVRLGGEDTAAALRAEVERYAEQCRVEEAKLLRSAGVGAAGLSEGEIPGLEPAVVAWIAALAQGRRPTRPSHLPQHWEAIVVARQRVVTRAIRRSEMSAAPTYDRMLGDLLLERPGQGAADAALLAADALSRIPEARGEATSAALRALLACLVTDSLLADCMEALIRLRREDGMDAVHRHLSRIEGHDVLTRISDSLTRAGHKVDLAQLQAEGLGELAERARQLARTDQRAEALKLVNMILGRDPDQRQALLTRAQLRALAREVEGAAQDLERYLRLGEPSEFRDVAQVGSIYSALGRLPQAAEYLRRAADMKVDPPQRAAVLANLGQLSLIQGRREEALRWMERAVALDRSPETLMRQATVLLNAGDPAGCVKVLEEARALAPDNSSVLLLLQECYRGLHRYKEALELADSVLTRRPDMWQMRRDRAALHLLRNDPHSAVRDIRLALQNAPQGLEGKGQLLNLWASADLQVGRLADAVEHLELAVKTAPEFHEAWANLALAREALGDPDGAEHAARTALKLSPRSQHALHALAKVAFQRRDFRKARELSQQLLSQGAKGEMALKALLVLGNCQIELHDLTAARATLEQAHKLAPKSDLACARLAQVELVSGNQRRAEELAAEACTLAPERAEGWGVRGSIELGAKRYAQAAQYLQRSLQLNDREPGVWFFYGEASRALGKLPQAEEAYRKVLQMVPGNAHAHLGLGLCVADRDRREALDHVRRFLELAPNDPQAEVARRFVKEFGG
ncbi:MAG: protein kinase [Planctomycetota bacterium]